MDGRTDGRTDGRNTEGAGERRNGETPNPKCNSARDAGEGPTDRPTDRKRTIDRMRERGKDPRAELIEGNKQRGESRLPFVSLCPLHSLHLPMYNVYRYVEGDRDREEERVELMQNAQRTLFDNVSVASAPPPRRPASIQPIWWICLEKEANTKMLLILPFRDAHERRAAPVFLIDR